MLGDACISIGLRRSGLSEPYLRIARIGNARPVPGDRLALGELLEDAGDDRLHRPRRRLPARRSSFRRRAGRIRPADGRRAGPRRGSRARSGSSGRSPPSSAAACTAAAPAAARRTCRDGCATAPGSRARLPATTPSGSASGIRRSLLFIRLRIESMTLAPQHDVLVQLLAAQVEEAVLQADVFGIVEIAEHRQRQFPPGRAPRSPVAKISTRRSAGWRSRCRQSAP
jgi:hypothetical protein